MSKLSPANRELLELAAKAAGIDAEAYPDDEDCREGLWLKGARTADNNSVWNPGRDDGDALRLANALGAWAFEAALQWMSANLDIGGDRDGGFRIAIVNVAAEKGREIAAQSAIECTVRAAFEQMMRKGGHGPLVRRLGGSYMDAHVHSTWQGYFRRAQDEAAIFKARAEEVREQCAKVCDERAEGWTETRPHRDESYQLCQHGAKNEARALAVAIRALPIKDVAL